MSQAVKDATYDFASLAHTHLNKVSQNIFLIMDFMKKCHFLL